MYTSFYISVKVMLFRDSISISECMHILNSMSFQGSFIAEILRQTCNSSNNVVLIIIQPMFTKTIIKSQVISVACLC